ncbi:MAG: hypothetical protein K8R02_02810 [Anaerohalosphaeraceae bacterium]|nr:hypothetical protein [Anaerohalosphaeraceae bacterium]
MILLNDGISKVKAQPCYGSAVMVSWQSTYAGKRHQVYVNGKFVGVTEEASQRQLLVNVPFSEQSASTIEVFAIEAGDAEQSLKPAAEKQARAELIFTKEQFLPVGAKTDFFYDNQSGNVDYQNRLNENDIRIWQGSQEKGGFGLSKFGESDFGRDSSAAAGFGKALFGEGGFGFEGLTVRWQSKQLSAGRYKFGIKLRDEFGNESTQTVETQSLTIIPPVMPGEKLEVAQFDKDSGQIIFAID